MSERIVEGFRLSPQQKRLWLLQQEGDGYCAQYAVLLEGDLRADVLQASVREVVRRHEVLRTTFRRHDEIKVPLQIISEAERLEWRDFDLSGREPHAREVEIEELLLKERRRAFDFEQGPLLRAALVALSKVENLFFITLPSLCADAESLKILMREVSRFYAAHLEGETPDGEPFQYVDFAEWQNELLEAESTEAEAGKSYWSKQDFSSAPALKLPFENERGALERFEASSLVLSIAPNTLANVEAVARDKEVSVATFLLACWQTLLWRLTGQTDIVVGSVFDGRKYEELRDALGLFAGWLPVRCRLEGDPQFAEVLLQTGNSVQEINEWQEFFDREEGEATSPEREKLLVGFGFKTFPAEVRSAGVKFSFYRQYDRLNPFKLELSCASVGDSLTLEFRYNPRAFRPEAVKLIAEEFETLLTHASRDIRVPVSRLELLNEANWYQQIVAFNQTAAYYPVDECFHHLFEEQVERTPERVAVSSGDSRLTYGELNARANQLAHFLRRRQVGPDVCVGLAMEPSAEAVVGLLGILKAGGAYVPLNLQYPEAGLRQQIEEAGITLLLTREHLAGRLQGVGGEVVCLDRDRALFEDAPRENPRHINSPQDLVYVIYTSGSTGVPKGVAVTHESLVNYTSFICKLLQLNESPVDEQLHFATVSTIAADLGNTCIFPSLASGGCLHPLSYDLATDSAAFTDYVLKHPIDVLKIVPSHLNGLLAAPEGEKILPKKFLILGGEAFTSTLARKIYQIPGERKVINHYGPTETTVGSLTFPLEENKEIISDVSTVPIGTPVWNTRAYVLDPRLRPLPPGLAGELYLSGRGLARGYLSRPSLTAERFVPDPFSSEPGSRLYRTGDLTRHTAGGVLEYVGRRDTQVKVRGHRVELGEVEAALLRTGEVSECACMAREWGGGGGVRLVAYVVAAAGAGAAARDEASTAGRDEVGGAAAVAEAAEVGGEAADVGGEAVGAAGEAGAAVGWEASASRRLRERLRAELPDYMLPSSFVWLRRLPVTPNGKLDRKALPEPSAEGGVGSGSEGPRTPAERVLCEVWGEVLGVGGVSVRDNFFELGGDSILSIQVVARARRRGVRVSPREVFAHQTVEELAAVAVVEGGAEAEAELGVGGEGGEGVVGGEGESESGVGEGEFGGGGEGAWLEPPVTGPTPKAATEGVYTPSDFPLVRLDQQTIDRIVGEHRQIDDVYGLSPLQQGMLFHTLYEPEGGAYVHQVSCTMRGALDIDVFRRAWQRAVEEHQILRTAFVWEGVEEPVQVVVRRAEVPLEQQDWRGVSATEQQQRLSSYLEADRRRGFELSRAPLMRLALLQTSDDAYIFVWSNHHTILDGWSRTSLMKQVFELYETYSRGEEVALAPRRPYGDYIRWLAGQDLSAAEAYWRRTLAGFSSPTRLRAGREAPGSAAGGEPGSYRTQDARLGAELSRSLAETARRERVTLNTVVQGAWALLLSRYAGAEEVVFGATVSGRPAELEGVEAMVGLFINTLPVRARVEWGEAAGGWLRGLQSVQAEAREYEFAPLRLVQRWGGGGRGESLFESIIVFENHPFEESLLEAARGIVITDVRHGVNESYPLVLTVVPGEQLSMRIRYQQSRFEAATVAEMLNQIKIVLQSFAAEPDAPLSAHAEALARADMQQQLANQKEYEEVCLEKLQSVRRKVVRN